MATKKKSVEESTKKGSLNLMGAIQDMVDKDDIGKETKYIPNYPSHIDLLDYNNGRFEDGEVLAGFDGGKIITVIGKSGSGKSTLAIQIASSIVKPYDNGQIIHFDFENATTKARFKTISGWSSEEMKDKYMRLSEDIYTESLYKFVKNLGKLKLENFDDLKIDSGKVDEKGNPIYVLPPSVLLVDSWALVTPKDIAEEEELSGQMSATSIARTNNSVVKRINTLLGAANITMIVINHITVKVEIGPIKTSNSLNYLGQDESTPGGTSIIYLANSLIKVQAASKLEPDKDFRIKGFMVTAQYIKSRCNAAGRKFTLVFDQANGFDNFLTNFNYMKEQKLLKGNGRAYYFDFDPDTKFTQANVRELYNTNKKWAKMFDKTIKELYSEIINMPDEDSDEEDTELELVECVDEEQDIWLGNDGKYYTSEGEEVEVEEE